MLKKNNVFNSSSNSSETSRFCKLVTHALSHLILMRFYCYYHFKECEFKRDYETYLRSHS